MAYECPKCGGRAKRKAPSGKGAMMFGAVGALLAAAFSFNFWCPACGDLKLADMPPGTKNKVLLSSTLMILIAVALLGGVIALLVYMND